MKKERFFERALVALSIAIVIILMHGCGGNKSLRNDDPNSRAPQEVYVYNYHLEKDAIKYKVARGMNTRMHSGWEIVVEKCVKDIDKSVTCYINVFNWGKDRNFDIMKDGSFMIDDYDNKVWSQTVKATRHGLFRDTVKSNEAKLFKILFLDVRRSTVADLNLACEVEGEGYRNFRFSNVPIDRDF
ncbi:MAG: hypothetical protein ABFD15_07690 [Methanofastidiosum sp.]|jgi:hypothetical protein